MSEGRRNTQHDDTKFTDTKFTDTQHDDTKFIDTQHNDTQFTDTQLGNCDIDFYNFHHRKVWNFEISNQFERQRNFTDIFWR